MTEISAMAELQMQIRLKESEMHFWESQLTETAGPNTTFMRIQLENIKASLIGLRLAYRAGGGTDV